MDEASAPLVLARRDWDAVLFDLDGVLTDTARIHAVAWQVLFDEVLHRQHANLRPFDPEGDYLAHVDGRKREDGVRGFLASRGLVLPEGSAADPPDALTVAAVARRKQALFEDLLRRQGVAPLPGAAALLRALRARGMPIAVVSASRNCAAVLEAAGLEALVDTRVDGVEAARLGLPGKPAPDTFLEAARRLGAAPARCVVVEDAQAGVEAGQRGGFGLVIGIDRHGQAEALRQHGAHRVVRDLTRLSAA
ncbi:HAD family hydrolase [Falsiroseomonas sp. E2-1-a20]|uniref:HAD family hydrolase n=1 Tax=Falsiroseomonas sp. E2-1-a20 TaxID=3239300 RepID=UPI003F3EE22B